MEWSSFPWGMQFLSSLAGMAFNLSIAVGVATTYPLYVAVGTIMGLPLNVAVDAWQGAHVGVLEGIGMGLVGLSFVSLAVADAVLRGGHGPAAESAPHLPTGGTQEGAPLLDKDPEGLNENQGDGGDNDIQS